MEERKVPILKREKKKKKTEQKALVCVASLSKGKGRDYWSVFVDYLHGFLGREGEHCKASKMKSLFSEGHAHFYTTLFFCRSRNKGKETRR